MKHELVPGKWYRNKLYYEFSSNKIDDGYWNVEIPASDPILFLEKNQHIDYYCTLKFLWKNKIVYCHMAIDIEDHWTTD